MKTNQKRILIALGLLMISASFIVAHYSKLPDLMMGAMIGIGIGLLAISFLKPFGRNSRNTWANK